MIGVLSLLIAVSSSYIEAFPCESQAALDFASKYKNEIQGIRGYLTKEEALMAMCIVAPEISQYSKFQDAAETFALYTLYVQGQISDFSIGAFQMKPTFAIYIENEVSKCNYLSKYEKLIINASTDRAKRYERVRRLTSLKWQILYLSAFISVAKERTKEIDFKSVEEKLKYWATLYNAGLNTPEDRVYFFYDIEGFPKFSSFNFNYADVSLEFYKQKEFCPYLR